MKFKYSGEKTAIEVFIWLGLNVIGWSIFNWWWLLDGGKEWVFNLLA